MAKKTSPKKPRANAAPKTKRDGTWTEARFWQEIRMTLRKLSLRWPPRAEAKKKRRRLYTGPKKGNLKWEYQCDACRDWFPDSQIEMDHITKCGSCNYDAIAEFIVRLFCDSDGYQVLCLTCHSIKTFAEADYDQR
jgi:hypothetical protein